MLKYQKFQAPISRKNVLSKNDQMLWFMQKLLSFVIILLWEVIYIHFYNWDRPLDLVPVLYDLIELIIEASLWSKDYSTLDTHLQHTRLCSNNAYLIFVIVHAQMWCICLSTCWSNPKIFLSFARSLQLRASLEMCLREIKKSHFHIKSLTTASWVFHD